MRLIDADKFKGKVIASHTGCGVIKLVAINDVSTAYNLGKVVEQLEEKTELAYRRYMDCPSYSPCSEKYRTQYMERKMCLEIVKGGEVNGN